MWATDWSFCQWDKLAFWFPFTRWRHCTINGHIYSLFCVISADMGRDGERMIVESPFRLGCIYGLLVTMTTTAQKRNIEKTKRQTADAPWIVVLGIYDHSLSIGHAPVSRTRNGGDLPRRRNSCAGSVLHWVKPVSFVRRMDSQR